MGLRVQHPAFMPLPSAPAHLLHGRVHAVLLGNGRQTKETFGVRRAKVLDQPVVVSTEARQADFSVGAWEASRGVEGVGINAIGHLVLEEFHRVVVAGAGLPFGYGFVGEVLEVAAGHLSQARQGAAHLPLASGDPLTQAGRYARFPQIARSYVAIGRDHVVIHAPPPLKTRHLAAQGHRWSSGPAASIKACPGPPTLAGSRRRSRP